MAGIVVEGERPSSAITVESIGSLITNPPSTESTLSQKFSNSAGPSIVGGVASFLVSLVPGANKARDLIQSGIDAAQANMEAEQKQNTYIQGIKYMADRNMPGFVFHETQINGENVQIAVDARSLLEKDNTKVWLWTSAENITPDVQIALQAARNKAEAGLMEFDQTTRNNFSQRKTEYIEALKQYTEQVAATQNQQEMDVMKFPPNFRSTPREVLDERISKEFEAVLKRAYSDDQQLPPPVQIIQPVRKDPAMN